MKLFGKRIDIESGVAITIWLLVCSAYSIAVGWLGKVIGMKLWDILCDKVSEKYLRDTEKM